MQAIKHHSKGAITKRLKNLSKGKLKHWHSNTRHLAYSKTNKQSRRLHTSSLLDSTDWKRLKKII